MQTLTPTIHGYHVESRIVTRPFTAFEFAEHAKIDTDLLEGETLDYINSVIDSAVAFAEKFTRRTLIESNMLAYLDQFTAYQSYELRSAPVNSITNIQYYLDGSLETIDSDEYFYTSSNRWHRIFLADGESWPTTDYRAQAIEFRYVAGYTDSNFPHDLKMALMQHALAIYSSRGDCTQGSGAAAMCSLPVFVKNVYSAYKIRDVGLVV